MKFDSTAVEAPVKFHSDQITLNISWLPDFTRFGSNTSYDLVNLDAELQQHRGLITLSRSLITTTNMTYSFGFLFQFQLLRIFLFGPALENKWKTCESSKGGHYFKHVSSRTWGYSVSWFSPYFIINKMLFFCYRSHSYLTAVQQLSYSDICQIEMWSKGFNRYFAKQNMSKAIDRALPFPLQLIKLLNELTLAARNKTSLSASSCRFFSSSSSSSMNSP